MAEDDVIELKEKLLGMTTAFCSARLNKEYQRLTTKLINRMAWKRPAPFLRGRLENWAAGINHAVGSINFRFDKSFKPYVASPDIAAYFGVSQSTMGQKSKVIRDMFAMDQMFGNQEFQTAHMKKGFAPIEETIHQLAAMLIGEDRLGIGAVMIPMNSSIPIIPSWMITMTCASAVHGPGRRQKSGRLWRN